MQHFIANHLEIVFDGTFPGLEAPVNFEAGRYLKIAQYDFLNISTGIPCPFDGFF
jgi:hypothetical protein